MLSQNEINALNIAMQDEYEALNYYTAAIDVFGNIAPFKNIVESEKRHIAALQQLFKKYGISVPPNDVVSMPPLDIKEACSAGVQEEIDNIRMYDALLQQVEQQDIKDVFYRLQAASFNHHLPAFQACLEKQNGLKAEMESFYKNVGGALRGDMGCIEDVATKVGSSFVTGVLVGGLAGVVLAQMAKKKDRD